MLTFSSKKSMLSVKTVIKKSHSSGQVHVPGEAKTSIVPKKIPGKSFRHTVTDSIVKRTRSNLWQINLYPLLRFYPAFRIQDFGFLGKQTLGFERVGRNSAKNIFLLLVFGSGLLSLT